MKGKDGEIKTKKIDAKPKIIYLDQNDFIKKQKALKRYLKKSYKYLVFEVEEILKKKNEKEGKYELDLLADDLFKSVYGELKLIFSVVNDIVVIEDIVPNDILIECYMKNLPVYKGVPYRNKKDLFKIKMLEGRIWGK